MRIVIQQKYQDALFNKTKKHLIVQPNKKYKVGSELCIECGYGEDKIVVKAKITELQEVTIHPASQLILVRGKTVDANQLAINNGLSNADELCWQYRRTTKQLIVHFTDFKY